MILVRLTAGIEGATGSLLLIAPSFFSILLLGEPLPAAGETLGRLAGAGLLAMIVSCWPRNGMADRAASQAPLLFSAGSSCILAAHAMSGGTTGLLFWPALLTHLGFCWPLLRNAWAP